MILDSLPDYEKIKGAESFLLGYIAFESLVRKVWHFYRSSKSNKGSSETHAPLPLPSVKSTFSAYNIKVSDAVITAILSSDMKKRGSMSARNLRNGLVHQWKENDRLEVIERYDELMSYLKKVIAAIKVIMK